MTCLTISLTPQVDRKVFGIDVLLEFRLIIQHVYIKVEEKIMNKLMGNEILVGELGLVVMIVVSAVMK
jgi:hypothetical protein